MVGAAADVVPGAADFGVAFAVGADATSDEGGC